MKFIIRFLLFNLILLSGFSCIEQDKPANTGKEEKKDSSWYSQIVQDQVVLENASQNNYYIIFDGSGSMAGRKIFDAKNAVKKFINLIPDQANIGLLAFDVNGVGERAELGSPKKVILQEVDKIIAAESTPLGKSVEIALEKLALQAKKQLGYGEYNLIIITDGQATDLSRLNRAVNMLLETTPIVIHTIGFQIGAGHALNQPGKIYYKTAKDVEELSEGLKAVLAESEDFSVTQFQ